MNKNILPKPQQVYTLYEIIKRMYLPDIPHLMFRLGASERPLQTSHITEDQLLLVPGFATTKWQYSHTTTEWCPIFKYVDSRPMENFVLVERRPDNSLWITPVGFPRKDPKESCHKRLRPSAPHRGSSL